MTNTPSFMMKYCAVALLFLGGLALPAAAQGVKTGVSDKLRFDVSVTAGDPFDPKNQMKAAERLKVRRGQTVNIQIHGAPRAGAHTYPITRRTSKQPPSQLSQLTVPETKGLAALSPVFETSPTLVKKPELNETYFEHLEPFTWTRQVVVLPEAEPGPVKVPVEVTYVACDERRCDPPKKRVLYAEFEVTPDEPLALADELRNRLSAKDPEPLVVPVGETKPETAAAPPAVPAEAVTPTPAPAKVEKGAVVGPIAASHEQYKEQMAVLARQFNQRDVEEAGLLAFVLAGIFWGAVSLVTPCVFPMIPITVSFFLKQSEKEHHRPVVMASVYSLTIVVVLTLAAAFLLSVFRWLSINPLLNYGLGALFIFFALSLFGMYEIELPSGLARYTSAREGQGGLVGTMFMALTFTIISFACVAPFLGGFGGTAAAARPLWHNLLGGLAFSATFAAPFFLLALFPALLRGLPKSGSWLNSVKVVMGFLELAAAFKFFRAAELVQSGGVPSLFTFDLVLGIWIALCLLCGLYLIGTYNLPHDTPSESISVPRLLFSIAFLGLGLYLLPALFKSGEGEGMRPGGTVYAWVDSFLLPETRVGKSSELVRTGNLAYAIAEAREHRRLTGQPKRVFIDFTGET